MSSKLQELIGEFRDVVSGPRPWGDAVVPPLAFLIIHLCCGVWPAILGSIGVAVLLTVIRLVRGRTLRYALGGLGGIAMASGAAVLLNRGDAFFVPGLIRGGLTSLLCLLSVFIRRPLVAWTSFLARRWPLAWYWHPKVRPAYSEATLAWGLFFVIRLVLQFVLFQRGATSALALVGLILGWPALVLLLAGTYLYGLWRLRRLGGPSVQEFVNHSPAPWIGQKKGF